MYRECYSCDDILLVPRFSELKSRNECDPSFLNYSLPIIASCMDTVYSPEMDDFLTSQNIMVMVHRYFKNAEEQLEYVFDKKSNQFRFFAVGSVAKPSGEQWINTLLENGVKHFVVDMAHGDSLPCVETVKYLHERVDGSGGKIIAGNVATKSGFRRLEEAGAWAIRCGIGCGSICSTRLNTGFGVPLLATLEDCEKVRDSAYIIADGGVKHPGDIAKAIAFGADFVQSGRMFACTDLAPGDCYDNRKKLVCSYRDIHKEEYSGHIHAPFDLPPTKRKNESSVCYKEYRGMASAEARKGIMKNSSIEGVSGLIPYKGSTEDFLINLKNNLQASLSYAGARNWHEFRRNVKRIRISSASLVESQTHVEI
jgi:IMP dehydrogenase